MSLVKLLSCAALAALAATAGGSSSGAVTVEKSGVCMREGAGLAGTRPVAVARLKRVPKKILDVRPRFPLLLSTVHGSGNWVGEVLLDGRGRVVHVWPVLEPSFNSPAPAFNAAIVEAVQQWQFETVFVKAQPAAACMTVSVTIDWR